MAKFVDFKESVHGSPITVNPEYVIKVEPEPSDPDKITVIHTSDGHMVGVQGKHADVVKKLRIS